MIKMEMATVARLRERAAQCQRFARLAQSLGIAKELEKIAYEYETDAARIEISGSDEQLGFMRRSTSR
jgi:hypothetical protein